MRPQLVKMVIMDERTTVQTDQWLCMTPQRRSDLGCANEGR